jgi:MoaA/NifB/PqqE/SkfB family radical SAM enzyme
MCRSEHIGIKARRMPPELFERVAAELFGLAEMVDLRGWGESLILPEVTDRIRVSAESGATLRIVTNLSFRRPQVLDLLVGTGCHVAVSVDSADPVTFQRIRGGGNLAQVAENLSRLVEGNRALHGHADRIHLTTTVQRPALGELAAVVDFAAELGVPEIRLFTVTVPEGSPLALEAVEAETDAMLGAAIQRAEARGVRLLAGTRLGSMPENLVGGPACLHPWAYTYVAYDGSVGFCDHLIGPEGAPYLLGTLAASSFEEIWNGPAWTALRAEHVGARNPAAPRFHECAWCYRHRHVDFEHFFDPAAAAQRTWLHNPALVGITPHPPPICG